MSQKINQNGQMENYKKIAKLMLSKHFGEEIVETIKDNDSMISQYGKNIVKVREAQRIIKKVIKPLEKMFVHIDTIISFVEFVLKFDSNADNGDGLKNFGERLGIEIDENTINDIKKKNKAKYLIESLVKSTLKDKEYKTLSILLESVENDLALHHGFGIDKFGDTPSIISFLKSIKEELIDYKDIIQHLPIEGDGGTISKVEFADWLREQKKNGYIKLPYYEHLLADITNKGRPGKVGQVVLKGHPGTGKTSIFSYKSEKEQRPHRIISMHQYINFYELIIQNTNLSPTKNQLEFFKEVISDYQSLKPVELLDRLKELFQINKSNFPSNYTIIDFINTVFNISRFIKDKSKVSSGLLDQSDSNDHEKIQKHILTMLNYWKDEKIYKLLLAKKESVKGEILDAMEKGENVVLDEIDKVQEKEIEGLLAFLDLNTGKYHHIQGMEEKIYIPDRFGVYATSNDKFKPAGPLGRRFNSIELEYLDKKNLAYYIAAKISNSDLTTPFSDSEIEQIIKAIAIIQEHQNEESYSALDFSVRMIDTFVSNFVSYRNRIVEKKHTNKSESYIIDALITAFESQTQDVYGGNKGSNIDNQKKNLIELIKSEHLNEEKDEDEEAEPIVIGKKLNTSLQGKVELHIKNFGYDNPLLNLIIETKEKEEKSDRRMLHYPEQMGELIQKSNEDLSKFSRITDENINTEPAKDINVDEENYSVKYGIENKQLTIITNKNFTTPKIERFICDKVYTNPAKNTFIVFGPTGNKYITIRSNKDSEVQDLSKELYDININYNSNDSIDMLIFTHSNKLVWSAKNLMKKDILYDNKGNSIEIPDIATLKLYDSGLFGISHDKRFGMIVGLEEENSKNTSPFKDRIKPMIPFLKFNLKDLGFEDYEIQEMNFDSTGEYLFIHIKKGEIQKTLPIKL